MNKALLLKEMGISSWKSKTSGELPVFNSTQPESVMTTQEFPIWTLVFEEDDANTSLFKNIQTVVQNFGVKTQVLPFQVAKNSGQIQGDLVFCFGQVPGQFFSGETNPVEDLREILFETSSINRDEIPVIISYSMSQIKSSASKKKQLWEDLIFARNVYLDTMS
jgi:hypothetical protein